jgi:hypothetical protein
MENKRIRFAINDTLEQVFQDIIEVLPQVKTEWLMNVEGKEPFFTTEVNGVELEIYERKVVFKINKGGMKEEKRVYQKLSGSKKPMRINLYSSLVKRFADNEDYTFYKRILRFMNGHVTAQKARSNEVQFTEETGSGENS